MRSMTSAHDTHPSIRNCTSRTAWWLVFSLALTSACAQFAAPNYAAPNAAPIGFDGAGLSGAPPAYANLPNAGSNFNAGFGAGVPYPNAAPGGNPSYPDAAGGGGFSNFNAAPGGGLSYSGAPQANAPASWQTQCAHVTSVIELNACLAAVQQADPQTYAWLQASYQANPQLYQWLWQQIQENPQYFQALWTQYLQNPHVYDAWFATMTREYQKNPEYYNQLIQAYQADPQALLNQYNQWWQDWSRTGNTDIPNAGFGASAIPAAAPPRAAQNAASTSFASLFTPTANIGASNPFAAQSTFTSRTTVGAPVPSVRHTVANAAPTSYPSANTLQASVLASLFAAAATDAALYDCDPYSLPLWGGYGAYAAAPASAPIATAPIQLQALWQNYVNSAPNAFAPATPVYPAYNNGYPGPTYVL